MQTQQTEYVIVAAVAADETATSVLYEAAKAAQLRGRAQLHLVVVVPSPSSRPSASDLDMLGDVLASARKELQRRVDLLELPAPVDMTAHIRVGQPSESILAAAAELDADLLVVGTRRRRGLERAIFGSVSERVMQRAHCPVLVAMPKDHPQVASTLRREPPCPECVAVRRNSSERTLWCDRHARPHLQIHVYAPSDAPIPAYLR